MEVARKIMDRLHSLCYKICEYSSPREESIQSPRATTSMVSGKSSRFEKGVATPVITHHGKERNMLRMEQSVHVSVIIMIVLVIFYFVFIIRIWKH